MDPDTDRWVRSAEAQAKFRDLLDEIAAEGAHVYVLRYDKPAAVLVPVEWYERMKVHADAVDAYARQNSDVHRENMRLHDEISRLKGGE